MKKLFLVAVACAFGLNMFGCSKKQENAEEGFEPISVETLSTSNNTLIPQVTNETKVVETNAAEVAQSQAQSASGTTLATLPPAGPYKPTATEIQTALKNAGVYAGNVDGKIGPMTRKAVEAFQTSKGLKADGKVGPKTWEALSKYLNAAGKPEKKKKR